MAASSVYNFTLSSFHHKNHAPKFTNPIIRHSFKTLVPNSLPSLHLPPKLRQPIGKLFISSKPSCSGCQKNTSKYFVEKVAALLLGSLILAGCVKSRPFLAQAVQESKIVEEKGDADSSGSVDEEMCANLLRENPENVDALKMFVNLLMRRGKTGEAVEYVEKLIELQPIEMEWRLLQALCCEMIGNLRGMAIVMHKNNEGLAVFEMLEGALEIANREKKANEERNVRILIAQMHLLKGDLEEALMKFQDLIDENPRDFRPYLCQAASYSLLDEKQKAQEYFEIYQSLVPEEFPQRGFLDDVVLAAKTESKQNLEKELQP
ncbi:hypothetical protein OROHE_006772 [Orobanche hederae]